MDHPVEAFAKVVAVEDGMAWLEPEPAAACGGCAAKPGCGTASLTPKVMAAKRFAVPDTFRARIGERVVVGMEQAALTRASVVAFAIPLAGVVGLALMAAVLGASDGGTAAAAIVGLVIGIAVARRGADRLSAAGDLTPIYLRRADVSESCASAAAP